MKATVKSVLNPGALRSEGGRNRKCFRFKRFITFGAKGDILSWHEHLLGSSVCKHKQAIYDDISLVFMNQNSVYSRFYGVSFIVFDRDILVYGATIYIHCKGCSLYVSLKLNIANRIF